MSEQKMRPWQAVNRKMLSFCTVLADGENDAINKVYEQLARPGRRDFLRRWEEDGCQVRPAYN